MNYLIKMFATAFLLFVFSLPVSAEIYKWKNKDGTVVYSDYPPPGVEYQIKKLRQDRIERAAPEETSEKPEDKPSQEKLTRNVGDVTVVMYMTKWCGYCRKARGYINSLGVNLTEYDIDADKSKKEEMLKKSSGSRGVPLIDVEGIIIRGFVPEAIKAAVEKKRSL